MALTRPRLGQLDTSVIAGTDPIAVLHAGSTTANVDIGLLMNRANGLVSNVAIYWNESGNTFVTAFTANSGVSDSNITATSYASLTTGNLISQSNVSAQYFVTTGTGYGNIYQVNTLTANTVSTGNITGLTTTGNITLTGNILPSANITYDIGSPAQRFRSIYLSGNTIDLAGAVIKTDPTSGAIALIPQATATNPNPTGIVITPAGSITTVVTVAGVVDVANIANVANTSANTSTTNFANVTTTGNLTVGGNLTVAGTVTFTNSVIETSTETVLGVEIVGGNLVANSGTASTSTTTGALVVKGGAGVTGDVNIGGNLSLTGSFSATTIFSDRGTDGLDWNTLTTMGVYLINRSSWSGTSNTPINSQYFTGQLEVVNTGNVSIAQFYRPYNATSSGDVYWTRSKHSTNSWSSWTEIINGAETMDGGSF